MLVSWKLIRRKREIINQIQIRSMEYLLKMKATKLYEILPSRRPI